MLLIGDVALRESMVDHGLYVYDLGELWLGFTGLPFVFALWIVTREAARQRGEEVQALAAQLVAAKGCAYESLGSIADTCKEREWMGRDALIDYWQTLSYDLTPRHLAGVATFFRYARDLQLIGAEPEIRLFSS
jgi:chorismate dehydratase